MLRWGWAMGGAVVATTLAFVGQGCGSNKSSSSGGADAATDVVVTVEAGEAGPDCGPMPPTGTQVVASTQPLVVFAMTDDDHAVYENLTTQELYAVAVGGGTPSDIGKMTSQGRTVWTHGVSVVWLPIESDPFTSIAPLSTWTAATGTSVISKSAVALDSYYYTYDASKDGKYVAYFSTPNNGLATLTVSTMDGKTQMPLVSGIDLTDQSCFPPIVQFVNDTVIAQYCLPPVATADAGTPAEAATYAAFAAPGFTPVTFGSTFTWTPGFVQVDPSVTQVLLPGPAGTGLSLYPLAGGAPATMDANGVSGFFTANGDVLYTTNTSALMRYTAASGTATTLVASGLAGLLSLSPDGNWLQAASKQNASTGATDLIIAPAMAPGPLNAVVKTATVSATGFTADSKYSLFGTNFPSQFGSVAYDLEASKTAGGAASKVMSAAAGAYFTTGSKFVSNTNQSKSTGAADIVEVDLGATGMPTTLVSQADPNLFQTSTKAIVYSWYCNENAKAGIWTLTAP